jgi:ABC-type uncharacterized transport system ATPase subunit
VDYETEQSILRNIIENKSPHQYTLHTKDLVCGYIGVRDKSKNLAYAEASAGSQTIIVVSHRLAVMSMADFIVFMDKGEIIEKGTHQELIAKNNAYARFCEYQRVKEELEEIN